MNDDNIRYSREDLSEFDQIIQDKLTAARRRLVVHQGNPEPQQRVGHRHHGLIGQSAEDGADTAEKESMNQLASRQMKFIDSIRKRAGPHQERHTYGVTVASASGELTPKRRLPGGAPHRDSIEAKMARRD
ncbi:MAG: TraR/DksA family transcriptional regulator [Hymenobacter sp.]